MNRRSYLKSLAIIGVIASSFSGYKWYQLHQSVNPRDLLDKELLIAEIAEIIIPQTDTPGAKSANVHKYIMDVIINCTDVKVQNHFIRGLNDFEDYAISSYEKPFLKCSTKEKTSIVQHFADNANYKYAILNKINNKFLGENFFSKFRNLTIEGYCRSKSGATEGLCYDYIPGNYDACIPIKINQKSWATK
ncbi:gluconate 2-dehydrogenase subunit 3 family protein [Pedobacter rhodius]|uniref:Gluconate 2-dehydrogenase subunit 3 family protein n=1 Tax=Pedobacter rhodius TaxID=3004098 RepID=A0ABT4KVQ4_9SPHI|nr:gluconate 2-dehydrogenase subunit 3 family protein [Pedobacter sp. SJ11]MCZ4222996.1 gluconate 2-dehydrogenase subunit 3 family protein [Pedobacter sp. SJ11]